jgi:hypothetical protein
MSIDSLRAIVPPPSNPIATGTPEAMQQFEVEIGTRLPSDYREFVQVYGVGRIGRFFRVFSPFSRSKYTNLGKGIKDISEIFHQVFDPETFPYPFYPEAHGLLCWATEDNGNYIFWQTKGQPDEWPVVAVEVRGNEDRLFKKTMTEFLVGVLTKRIKYPFVEHTGPWTKDFKPFDDEDS